MAIQGSGPIDLQDLADEFGGSTPHSLSEYYRNGSLVPGNNTNVPTSGAIALGNFYNAVNEIIYTQSSSTTNMQLSSIFGSNWGSSVPKRLIVNSGIIIGGTGSYALRINGSMGGTLIIENSGSIQGKGGAANGGNGSNAIQADHTSGVTIINNSGGQIYAGGGGGGRGGNGGSGGSGGSGGTGGGGTYQAYTSYGMGTWASSCGGSCGARHGWPASQYTCVGYCESWEDPCVSGIDYYCHGDCRKYYAQNTNGGGGGSGGGGGGGGNGGNGGRGRGYNQSRHNGSGGSGGSSGNNGSGGSGGGTNAGSGGTGGQGGTGGTGGTGGNGGDWGANGGGGSTGNGGATGNTGSSGANGNRTNGSGGSGGSGGGSGSGGSGAGSRGTYITNRGSLTFTNNGSVAGA